MIINGTYTDDAVSKVQLSNSATFGATNTIQSNFTSAGVKLDSTINNTVNVTLAIDSGATVDFSGGDLVTINGTYFNVLDATGHALTFAGADVKAGDLITADSLTFTASADLQGNITLTNAAPADRILTLAEGTIGGTLTDVTGIESTGNLMIQTTDNTIGYLNVGGDYTQSSNITFDATNGTNPTNAGYALHVAGDAQITGDINVSATTDKNISFGSGTISGTLTGVTGIESTGNLTIQTTNNTIGYLNVGGDYTQSSNITFENGTNPTNAGYALHVAGDAQITGDIDVSFTTDKNISVGSGTINGTLIGVNDLTATGADLTLNTAADPNVTGNLDVQKGSLIVSKAFTATGTATVAQNATFNANFTAKNITVNGDAELTGTATVETTNGNFTVANKYEDTKKNTVKLNGKNLEVGFGTISGKLDNVNDLKATNADEKLTLDTTANTINGILDVKGNFQNQNGADFTAAGKATIGKKAEFNADFTAAGIEAGSATVGAGTTVTSSDNVKVTGEYSDKETSVVNLNGLNNKNISVGFGAINGTLNGVNDLTATVADLTLNTAADPNITGNLDVQKGSLIVSKAFTATGTATVAQNATFNANFTAKNITVNGAETTVGNNATVTAKDGNITTQNLTLGNASTIAVEKGNLDVAGTYSDTMASKVNVSGEFKYTGDKTIKSSDFTAGTVNVGGNQKLTLSENANVKAASSANAGTLILNRNSQFGTAGGTLTNNGTIIAQNGGTSTINSYVAGTGQIWIGEKDSTDIANARLQVNGNWSSNNRNINFAVDEKGEVGTIEIKGKVTNTASDSVILDGTSKNRNELGKKVSATPKQLITADNDSNTTAFQFGGGNTNSWKFKLDGNDNGTNTIWNLSAESEMVVPDMSSFFLTNIIGFDLPRAQNVNGPWVRVKGGALNDNEAQLDKTDYQMLQIGWDKSFNAALGGNWYTGIFLEGNWMYGRGSYYRDRGTPDAWLAGALKSSHRGQGAGLYVSRGFENNWYVDVLGRINTFDSKIDMTGFAGTAAHPEGTSSYTGKWTDSIFAFAIEVGKTFNSKNKRWSFNPYNRLLYNTTPGSDYLIQILGDDPQALNVHSHAADTWTNQLGGRLYLTSKVNGRDFGNIFVGGDYYQGLSGRFGVDVKAMENNTWKQSLLSRPKNDLSYGVGTAGLSIFPTDQISLSTQADIMFGEVSGWAITFGGRYSY